MTSGKKFGLWVALVACATTWACGDESGGPGEGSELSELPETLEPGTSLSFNPTVTIGAGNTFTYVNDEEDSPFTAEITDGTYTYNRGLTGAKLTLMGTASDPDKALGDLPATLELALGSGNTVEVTFDGETYQGTLRVPGGAMPEGGMPVEGQVPDDGTPAEVAAGLVGSHELEFGYPQEGAPWEAGTRMTFEVGADSTLTALGNTISGAYTLNGNLYAVYWNDGTYAWELTDNVEGNFNEINVIDATTMKWLGQWAKPGKFDEPAMEEGVYEADVTLTGVGASGSAVPPYEQGSVITVRYDANNGGALTVTDDVYGEVMPPLDRTEQNGDGQRVVYDRMDGDVTYTYKLELGADGVPTRITIEIADPAVGGYASSSGSWPQQ